MPKRKSKKTTMVDIRRYIEMNVKDVDDVMASRIYEVMTGFTASTKDSLQISPLPSEVKFIPSTVRFANFEV